MGALAAPSLLISTSKQAPQGFSTDTVSTNDCYPKLSISNAKQFQLMSYSNCKHIDLNHGSFYGELILVQIDHESPAVSVWATMTTTKKNSWIHINDILWISMEGSDRWVAILNPTLVIRIHNFPTLDQRELVSYDPATDPNELSRYQNEVWSSISKPPR